MSWISVHTSIDGPKLREFRKALNCSKFEATGILIYLWFWGLENAEKDGLLICTDKDDLNESISSSSIGCDIPVDKITDSLIETGWVDCIDNRYYIHDWEVWQEQWYLAKERRERDVVRKRTAKTIVKNQKTEISNNIDNCKAEDKKESKYSNEFETFWSSYPRKIDKGNAYKKYVARLNDGFSNEQLIIAAKNYNEICLKNHTDSQYIKHPKTFLSDALPFLDYIPKEIEPEMHDKNNGNPFIEYEE